MMAVDRRSATVTSTATATTMARGRSAITTTDRTARSTSRMGLVPHDLESAAFPTQQQQYYDMFGCGNKILHVYYAIYTQFQVLVWSVVNTIHHHILPTSILLPSRKLLPATDLLVLYHSLNERVKQALASGRGSGDDSERNGIPGVLELTREQELTVHMILSSNASWMVAIRKFLVIVFVIDALAGSCAVGRPMKNSTTQPLNSIKLNAIKGVYNLNLTYYFCNSSLQASY